MTKPNNLVKGIIDSIGKQLRDQFGELRSICYNPNTKGGEYEEVLRKLLDDYFGNVMSVDTKCAIIDRELKLLTTKNIDVI